MSLDEQVKKIVTMSAEMGNLVLIAPGISQTISVLSDEELAKIRHLSVSGGAFNFQKLNEIRESSSNFKKDCEAYSESLVDYSGLDHPLLEMNVTTLNLSRTNGFDLTLILNYSQLERIEKIEGDRENLINFFENVRSKSTLRRLDFNCDMGVYSSLSQFELNSLDVYIGEDSDLSLMHEGPLRESLEHLTVSGPTNASVDLSWISNFPNLKSLKLDWVKESNVDFLYEGKLSKLERLKINEYVNLKNLDFLDSMPKMNHLDVAGCYYLRDLSALNKDHFKTYMNVLKLPLSYGKDNIQFLSEFRSLKEVGLIFYTGDWNLDGTRHDRTLGPGRDQRIVDYEFLNSPLLKQSVQSLEIKFDPRWSGIDFLRGYRRLQHLDLHGSDTTDFSPLGELDICSRMEIWCKGFIDLNDLKNLARLNSLDIRCSGVEDFSPLLNNRSVKNGAMGDLALKDRMKWDLVNSGKSNRTVIKELEKMVSSVRYNSDGFYKNDGDELRILAEKFGFDQSIAEKIIVYDTLLQNNLAYSSKAVFQSESYVLKVADRKICENELAVYSLDMDEYGKFLPELLEATFLEKIGVIVMENISQRVPAQYITGIRNPHEHMMYLLAMFHTQATNAVSKSEQLFDLYPYVSLEGISHVDALVIPTADGSWTSKQLKEGSAEELMNQVRPIVDDFMDYGNANATCIVHGDVKQENIVNGYLVDYGMARKHSPVWDLAYYLADWDINQSPEFQKNCVQRYLDYRNELDPEFESAVTYQREMKEQFNLAKISAQVLKLSVLRKRPNTPFYQRRREHGESRIISSLKNL